MNSKEIAEIKKTFKEDRSSISRICGCYVDGEKNKVTEFKEAFLALPEEDLFKYFSIFGRVFQEALERISSIWNFRLRRSLKAGSMLS